MLLTLLICLVCGGWWGADAVRETVIVMDAKFHILRLCIICFCIFYLFIFIYNIYIYIYIFYLVKCFTNTYSM